MEPTAITAGKLPQPAHTATAGHLARRSLRRDGATDITLTPIRPRISGDRSEYDYVTVHIDRLNARAILVIAGPAVIPANIAELHRLGASFWLLAMLREVDDAILRLRATEPGLGTWLWRTQGNIHAVRMCETLVLEHADWLAMQIRRYAIRVLQQLDTIDRNLVALIDQESCYAGVLLEIVLMCGERYMRAGEDERGRSAALVMTDGNFGAYPRTDGASRLQAGFHDRPEHLSLLREYVDVSLYTAQATALSLVTAVPEFPLGD